jgi:integrase
VPEWIFTNEVGNRMDPDNFRKRVWPKLLEKAGLRHLRIHDLRHTFASLLIQQGESLVYVMEQMGHNSIRVTVDIYGHLVPGGNKAAVDRLDQAVSENAVSTGPKRTLSAPTEAVVELEAR